MEGITALVLRGISGVGKTVLTKLLRLALESLGKKYKIISKDSYRRYLSERESYSYTKEEEENTTKWYMKEFERAAKKDDLDYIICDNTHVRQKELQIPCIPQGNISKIVVIEVGTPLSPTDSKIGDDVIKRQRKEMQESEPYVQYLYNTGITEWFTLNEKEATQKDAEEIIKECELMKC